MELTPPTTIAHMLVSCLSNFHFTGNIAFWMGWLRYVGQFEAVVIISFFTLSTFKIVNILLLYKLFPGEHIGWDIRPCCSTMIRYWVASRSLEMVALEIFDFHGRKNNNSRMLLSFVTLSSTMTDFEIYFNYINKIH
jgi:hypothetical protein